MIYIGIDPGKGGGIAALAEGGYVLSVSKMPETPRDLVDHLKMLRSRTVVEGHPRAWLERVNAGVFGQGKMGRMGVVSAMTFGRGVGRLETALAATEIPFDEVSPITWQTALGCRTRGDKNISKARAQQLFPREKITHAIADALLLAEFGRRLDRGERAATRQVGETNGETEDRQDATAGKGQGPRAGKDSTHSVGAIEAEAPARPAQSGAPRHGASAHRKTRQPL